MNRLRTLFILLIAGLIVAWFWHAPPPSTSAGESDPKTQPPQVAHVRPRPQALAAVVAPSPPPPPAPPPVMAKPTVAKVDPEDAHKPPPGAVPFELKGGWVIAYGDILLGKPKSPDFAKSGFIEAPKLVPWAKGVIPFSVHASLPNPERILRVIAYMNAMTPVQFVPYTGQSDSLVFYPMDGLCVSYLGQIGGNQPIYLDDRCSDHEILHELMHALGFIHEHSRPDRDQYVRVQWNSIEPDKLSQFDVTPPALNEPLKGRPFDYHSVMLYAPTAFARVHGETTLQSVTNEPIQPTLDGLSAEDLERVRQLYGR